LEKYKTLIAGSTKGIGLVTRKMLEERGDIVTSFSRSNSSNLSHIKMPIEEFDYTMLPYNNYDNLIFAHRYRGNNNDEDFKISITSLLKILDECNNFLNNQSSIVILGSDASRLVFFEENNFYHATRSALSGINKYYSAKLGAQGIRCNMVSPGTVLKPENKDFYKKNPMILKKLEKITPLGKIGEAKDVGNLILFLCSNKSSFITGQNISIDGGLSNISQTSISKLF
tara:strand:- start:321 stop:1004 length:684 start_codon:yes stop_codon:yes gene_type:complete